MPLLETNDWYRLGYRLVCCVSVACKGKSEDVLVNFMVKEKKIWEALHRFWKSTYSVLIVKNKFTSMEEKKIRKMLLVFFECCVWRGGLMWNEKFLFSWVTFFWPSYLLQSFLNLSFLLPSTVIKSAMGCCLKCFELCRVYYKSKWFVLSLVTDCNCKILSSVENVYCSK